MPTIYIAARMPGMLRALALPLALLAAGCSAAGPGPEPPPDACEGEGKHLYHGTQEFINKCYDYCVPGGKCLAHVEKNHLHHLGIRGSGGCTAHGYTERSEFGDVSTPLRDYIQGMQGPCEGLRLVGKFKRLTGRQHEAPAWSPPLDPEPAHGDPALDPDPAHEDPAPRMPPVDEDPAPRTPRVCSPDQVPYEIFHPQAPDSCTVACVPLGECTEEADKGGFGYLGIAERGDCRDKGFADAPHGGVGARSLFTPAGPRCTAEFQLYKFARPAAGAPETGAGGVCERSETPYAVRNQWARDVCSVVCIPEGDCEDEVRAGRMSHFGVTEEGACDGFTKRIGQSAWFSDAGGPCKGAKAVHFRRSGHAQ